MKNSRISKTIRYLQLALMLIFFLSMPLISIGYGRVNADTTTTVITTPCATEKYDPNCEPPRLQELEVIAVRLLYAAWACGGIIFMVLLVLIGYTYMTSAGDQGKVESARKRGTQWIIGFLLFFFSQPIVATLMKGLISGNTTCFKDLTDPGFTFFFTSVCTQGDQANTNPSGTPGASTAPSIPGPTVGPSGVITGMQPAGDGVGGCCAVGALPGTAEGCYPGTQVQGGFSISVPAEECPAPQTNSNLCTPTTCNGTCSTKTSCQPSIVSDLNLQSIFSNVTTCLQRDLNRTFVLGDGTTAVCAQFDDQAGLRLMPPTTTPPPLPIANQIATCDQVPETTLDCSLFCGDSNNEATRYGKNLCEGKSGVSITGQPGSTNAEIVCRCIPTSNAPGTCVAVLSTAAIGTTCDNLENGR
jgi:hypothetical protein